MENTISKAKWTLWVPNDIKKFAKQWTKRHHESVSQLLTDYLHRLQEIEEGSFEFTPIVKRISGVIKGKKEPREEYKKHLEKKYLHG